MTDPNRQRTAPKGAVPPGVWIIARTPVDEPYPCRCAEAKYGKCNAAFCPCSGRRDPQGANCCGHRFTPEDAARAAAAWQEKKERERAGGSVTRVGRDLGLEPP